MADTISNELSTVISTLEREIIHLEKRETINVVMRIDETIAILKDVLAKAKGESGEYDLTITPDAHSSVTVTRNGSTVSAGSKVLNYGDELRVSCSADEGYMITALTINGVDYLGDQTITVTGNVTITTTAVAVQPTGNQLTIVNNSSNDVEIYYEEDKEEYGNTTIMGGATVTITIEHFSWDTPYFIRYASGGSTNSHVFTGVYQGVTETNLEVGYYDGNILPPNESKTDTRWVFESGDGGTLTISSGSPSSRIVTYDGTNPVAYGADADNLIEY